MFCLWEVGLEGWVVLPLMWSYVNTGTLRPYENNVAMQMQYKSMTWNFNYMTKLGAYGTNTTTNRISHVTMPPHWSIICIITIPCWYLHPNIKACVLKHLVADTKKKNNKIYHNILAKSVCYNFWVAQCCTQLPLKNHPSPLWFEGPSNALGFSCRNMLRKPEPVGGSRCRVLTSGSRVRNE